MVFSPDMVSHRTGRTLPTAERLSALLLLTDAIVAERNLSKLFSQLARLLRRVVDFNAVYVSLYDRQRNVIRLQLFDADFSVDIPLGWEFDANDTPAKLVSETQKPVLIRETDTDTRFSTSMPLFRKYGLHSLCMAPLSTSQRRLGIISFGSRKPDNYLEDDVEFIQLVAAQVAIAIGNALAYEEIEELKNRLSREKHYMEDEIGGDGTWNNTNYTSTTQNASLPIALFPRAAITLATRVP